MKRIISKKKLNNAVLSKHITFNNIEIYDAKSIAENLTKFLVNVGPNLAAKIPQSDRSFQWYLQKMNTTLNEIPLTEDEFEKSFKSLKRNKASGPDHQI